MQKSALFALALYSIMSLAGKGSIDRLEAAGPSLKPYLQSPTESSLWVCWQADSLGTAEVRYGLTTALSESAYGKGETIGGLIPWHAVQLNHLQPGSNYYYQCRSGGQQSDTLVFRTPPAPGSRTGHLRFAYISDNQDVPDQARATLRALKERAEALYGKPLGTQVSLLMNSGDLAGNGRDISSLRNEFVETITELSGAMPVMITLGNHEEDSPFYYQLVRYDAFAGPEAEAYYAFRWGPILFLCLNSMYPYSQATQLAWLQQVLDMSEWDDTIDWVLAFCHYPPWSEAWPTDNSTWVADQLIPLLSAFKKVELLAYGHSHTYARGSLPDAPMRLLMQSSTSWLARWREIDPQIDYAQIQKTFDHITYTLFDFDLAARSYQANTYSLGHPQRPLDNVLIDSFSTSRTNRLPPAAPILIAPVAATGLPADLRARANPDSADRQSAHIQITTTAGDYRHPFVDVRRDYENIFYDTGAPDWFPIDRNAGIDLTRFTVTAALLPEPHNYFWRCRYRNRNLLWSDWSEEKLLSTTTIGYDSIRQPGQALRLDGLQGYVELATTTEALPTRDLTVETWIKVNRLPSLAAAIGAVQSNGGEQKGWYLGCANNALTFALSARGADDGDGMISQLPTRNIKVGEWYHVAGTYDGTVMTLFFEGKPVRSTAIQSGDILYADNMTLTLGAYADANELYILDGELDEVRLWNVALPESTIQDWMHQNIIPSHPFYDHLVSYYPMENGIKLNRLYDVRKRHDGYVKGINRRALGATTAPLGATSVFITSNTPASVGPPGAQLTLRITSVPHDKHYLTAYENGQSPQYVYDAEPGPENINHRIGPVWGVREYGYGVVMGQNIKADLYFDYSAIRMASPTGVPALLRRPTPDAPWEDISATAQHDSLGFHLTGVTRIQHEFAIGLKTQPTSAALPGHKSGPETTILLSNYPNPFNLGTNIYFALVKDGYTTLKIYDITGKVIKTLIDEHKAAGHYSIQWNGTNEKDQNVPSGLYFYRMTCGEYRCTKRMLLLK